MNKRQVRGKDLLRDLKAGVEDQILMQRYELSAQGLQSVFSKLMSSGLLSQADLDARVPPAERTVDIGLYVCASCGNIQAQEFSVCPRCGFRVPEHLRKKKPETEVTSGVWDPDAASSAAKTPAQATSAGKPASPSVTPGTGPAAPETKAAPTAEEQDTLSVLKRLGTYCRVLGAASVVSCVLLLGSLFGLMQLSAPDARFTIGQALLALVALGVPTVVISLTVFVTLRVLGESLKAFVAISSGEMKR